MYKYKCEASQMLADGQIARWVMRFTTSRMIEGKADIDCIKRKLFGGDRVILGEPVLLGAGV